MATGTTAGNNDTSAQADQAQATERMFQIVSGFWLSRAVQVAAALGIPDLVASEPKPVEELAAQSSTHAPTLYRLLRALASFGIFQEAEGRRFASTALSDVLRSNVPDRCAPPPLRNWETYIIRLGDA